MRPTSFLRVHWQVVLAGGRGHFFRSCVVAGRFPTKPHSCPCKQLRLNSVVEHTQEKGGDLMGGRGQWERERCGRGTVMKIAKIL